jgi:ABC-type lipoprotein export system ATPase subunit
VSSAIPIPRISGEPLILSLDAGSVTVIVGANGSGKTRLASWLELSMRERGHRIPAHKSLEFPPEVQTTTLESAMRALRYGHPQPHIGLGNRVSIRWNSRPATHLLTDTAFLLQALIAEHSKVAIRFLAASGAKPGERLPLPVSVLDRLRAVWARLLPHRRIEPGEASIEVETVGEGTAGTAYNSSEMSDGERAIFYYLGQSLLAPKDGVIIVDEPEAHLHKAILGSLWDEIEAARPDCAFIYITHDLDFATQRYATRRLVLRIYRPGQEAWDIDPLPSDAGMPENVVALIAGSRRPTLFVEGTTGSADIALYRIAYPEFTIVPLGASADVIHAVGTFRRNASLHSVGKVRGLVDLDGRGPEDLARLKNIGVHCLPTSEIEGAFLLPPFLAQLAEGLRCPNPEAVCTAVYEQVYASLKRNVEGVAIRYVKLVIDRRLRMLNAEVKSPSELGPTYATLLGSVDVEAEFTKAVAEINRALADKDPRKLLALYDSKELLGFAASGLGLKTNKTLIEKMAQFLNSDDGKLAREALRKELPNLND